MSDKQSRRGRPPKSEADTVGPRILAAATSVFLKAGYDQANMSEVAKQASCSKKTLYLRFPSKLELFEAFLQFFVEERLQGVRISVMPDEPLQVQLVSMVRVIRGYVVSEEAYHLHRLMVQDGRRFPELAHIFETAAWVPANGVIQDLLRLHFANLADEDLSFLSAQFLALAALRPLHDHIIGRAPSNEPAERVVGLFLNGCSGMSAALSD